MVDRGETVVNPTIAAFDSVQESGFHRQHPAEE